MSPKMAGQQQLLPRWELNVRGVKHTTRTRLTQRVWAQQEIREAREALDAECARERDWGSRQVQDSEASESHWQAATPVL